MPDFGEWSLVAARIWLRKHWWAGATCPCCGHYLKVYKRKLNSGQARSLIKLYRRGPGAHHLPSFDKSKEATKLRWWGLITENMEMRPHPGRSGYWEITEQGRLFVEELIKVPKYAVECDNELKNLEGDPVGIQECLGSKFDLEELLSE